MALTEIIIPLTGASVAVLSLLWKNWLARKSNSEIVINMGNGSKITLDGSEESREKVRKVLSESFGSPEQSNIIVPQEKADTPGVRKDQ